jgi:hypothetical protein
MALLRTAAVFYQSSATLQEYMIQLLATNHWARINGLAPSYMSEILRPDSCLTLYSPSISSAWTVFVDEEKLTALTSTLMRARRIKMVMKLTSEQGPGRSH